MLIDATAIPSERGGVGRYVDNIVAALVTQGMHLVVTCQPRDAEFFGRLGATAVAIPGIKRAWRRIIWEQVGLPRLVRRYGIDVVHSPHYTFPILVRAKRVVTIHDLTFFTLPEVHLALKRVFFRGWIREAARRRIAVITVSQATEREFIRIAKASPEKIMVSHLGYDAEQFHPPTADAIASLHAAVPNLPPRWISFLGTLEPRKNATALVEGYRQAMKDVDSPPSLLLAGGDGWDTGVGRAIERAKSAGLDVRRLGYLPVESLSAFLGLSTIFAYPSLGEGFGLPIIEAMATGTCVLTTDRLSLPEVGGRAVAYTGVSPEEIAIALRELLLDDARRSELSGAGLEHVRDLTWDAAATRHRAAYAAAAAGAPTALP